MELTIWERLSENSKKRSRLESIREAVEPILGVNNLPHFTDHSVAHSDQLCSIVDHLTAPLNYTDNQLNENEAFIIYFACYIHDIGMQYQRAGDTETMQKVLSAPPYDEQRWGELSIETKRDLLRSYHHVLSAEMIRSSINVANPILGIHLREDDYPGYTACLCESHCISPDSERYSVLVNKGPNLRMPLLAALLRLADLLDESRKRANLDLTNILDLDVTSQMHWWRNYYVHDITFDLSYKSINIWFDFPPERRVEYKKLIPQLQIPYIQEELSRQQQVLSEANLFWTLKEKETPEASSISYPMPNDVHMKMVEDLTKKRSQDLEIERQAIFKNLQEHRPVIEREFESLRNQESNTSPEVYIQRAYDLAKQLWEIEGKREAWMLLSSEFNRMKNRASSKIMLDVGFSLCRMMLDDDSPDLALHMLMDLQSILNGIGEKDGSRNHINWLQLYVETLIKQCSYTKAVEFGDQLINVLPEGDAKLGWKIKIAEISFLQGNLNFAESLLWPREKAE